MRPDQFLEEILELMRLDSDFPHHGYTFEPQKNQVYVTVSGTGQRFLIKIEEID